MERWMRRVYVPEERRCPSRTWNYRNKIVGRIVLDTSFDVHCTTKNQHESPHFCEYAIMPKSPYVVHSATYGLILHHIAKENLHRCVLMCATTLYSSAHRTILESFLDTLKESIIDRWLISQPPWESINRPGVNKTAAQELINRPGHL